ncbi:MAG TPA: SAM-dependent methyltransferase [Actinomycetota bacterium]|nr:SAM-dependent methyltransferase [Actinomycetota bacterium]
MATESQAGFERLLDEAEARPTSGWDFSWLGDRYVQASPSWSYDDRARQLIGGSRRFVDLGTGGGEALSRMGPFPAVSFATEAYAPNVGVAAGILRPLGVCVLAVDGAPDNDAQAGAPHEWLPFRDSSLDLVLARHESYWACDVRRVLQRGGTFLTQQVGGTADCEVFRALEAEEVRLPDVSLSLLTAQLRESGLDVVVQRQEAVVSRLADVGAVAWYAKMLPWQFPGFSIAAKRAQLWDLHRRIGSQGPVPLRSRWALVEAVKP